METQEFPEANLKLLAGDNPNTNDMPASQCVDKSGTPFIVGKFKLSAEEHRRLLQTGELWICVMGGSWPPILPTVWHPFEELGFSVPRGTINDMRHREPVEAMLKRVYFDPDWMTEDGWQNFLFWMGQKFNFYELGEKLERGLQNGHSIEEQLKETERIMIKIITKDALPDLLKNVN